jgi:hypothetical protein
MRLHDSGSWLYLLVVVCVVQHTTAGHSPAEAAGDASVSGLQEASCTGLQRPELLCSRISRCLLA